jgi:hypothetical protein
MPSSVRMPYRGFPRYVQGKALILGPMHQPERSSLGPLDYIHCATNIVAMMAGNVGNADPILGPASNGKLLFDRGELIVKSPYLTLRENVTRFRDLIEGQPVFRISTSFDVRDKIIRAQFNKFADKLSDLVIAHLGEMLMGMPMTTIINVAVGLNRGNVPVLSVDVLLMGELIK